MRKFERLLSFILCVAMLVPILGCAKEDAPQSSAPPSSSAVESEPEEEEKKPAEPYTVPVFNIYDKKVFTVDRTNLSYIKRYHKSQRLMEYEEYNGVYYYIIKGYDNGNAEIYSLAPNSEPQCLISTSEYDIEHIAVCGNRVFFTTPDALYSIPAGGGEPEELLADDIQFSISFIDAISSDTVFLLDTRGTKIFDRKAEYGKFNENGEFEIKADNHSYDKYYCYSLSEGALKESTREEYLTKLNEKEYFDSSRFRVFNNFNYNGNSVVVYDYLAGTYKQFDNISNTLSADSNLPCFVRENEVLKLTPYEETVICRAESSIVDFCFDNSGKTYFVSEGNLYLANDSNGNNTLITNVGEVNSIKYEFNRETSSWGICLQSLNNGEIISSFLDPSSENKALQPLQSAQYPLNRSSMTYEEYFFYQRLVFETSVYGQWEIRDKDIIETQTGKVIFSADAPIECAFLSEHLYFYISGGYLYRYHIDSGTNEKLCEASNASSIQPLSNICGTVTLENGEVKYFNTAHSYSLVNEKFRVCDAYTLSNTVIRTQSEYPDFPSLSVIQTHSLNRTWEICKEVGTLKEMSYDEYFSEERFIKNIDAVTTVDGNKVIEKETGKILLEAENPIQDACVSDYLIFYSSDNNLYRYHRASKTTDYVCSLEGATHFGIITNMAGTIYMPENDQGEVEYKYFDLYDKDVIVDESERVKALSSIGITACFSQKPEHYDYTPLELQGYSVYELGQRYLAWCKDIGMEHEPKFLEENLSIAYTFES